MAELQILKPIVWTDSLNDRTMQMLQGLHDELARLRIAKHVTESGATIYDFGIKTVGSLAAGLALAKICMADLAEVSIAASNPLLGPMPIIQVQTDDPVRGCLAAQYAGWPIKTESYFGMGSGPMRTKRGKEKMLVNIAAKDAGKFAVGVIESETLPDDSVACQIALECSVHPNELAICVAPTSSISGLIQVVARSVETTLHQLHELGGDLSYVQSAVGFAPMPPPGKNFMASLGRTNDAILYGGQVVLWVSSGAGLLDLAEKIPSCTAKQWGRPFADIFASSGHDFYKIDPALFAPAMVTIVELESGRSKTSGIMRPDCIAVSFGIDTASIEA